MWFRRRPAATASPPPDGHDSKVLKGPDALRAPSTLHAFNRYEKKYLVAEAHVPRLREHLARRMGPHAHAGQGG